MKTKKGNKKVQGVNAKRGLKSQLEASVWREERYKAEQKLFDIRRRAEKLAGDIAVKSYIKKMGWEKYDKSKNPHGKEYSSSKK